MSSLKNNTKILKFLDLLKSKVLLFVVFITGACVLVLEVLATRILSPFFGTTIFTISSVIGVILTALSFGYFWGGRFADKNPYLKNFYQIIFLSGIATLILQILTVTLLPFLGHSLPFTSGPLISSLFLFTLPSFLLGTLSPYAIKLQETRFPKTGVGKLSGEVFFVSTFGSIFGTLLGGFYLIPTYGIDKIVIGVGIVLVCLGVLGLFSQKKSTLQLIKLIFISSFIVIVCLSLNIGNPDLIYSKDGVYEKLTIYDGEYNGKEARILMQDRSLSSAYYPESDELAFEYTKYYTLYKLIKKQPHRVLFIGGGAYSMPHFLVNELPTVEVDVAEIEPSLYELSKKYFGVGDNPRLRNHVIDGRRFLYDSNGYYDMIFSDVYSSVYSIPSHFTTLEFFELAKSKLSPGGIFVANIIADLSRSEYSLGLTEIKTFQKVFPKSYFFAVVGTSFSKPQNIIFLGINSDEEIKLDDYGKTFKDDEIISQLGDKVIDLDRFNLLNYPVLRDNFAPIEILSANLIQNLNEKEGVFSGDEALSVLSQIVNLGPRFVGSDGHDKLEQMIASEMGAFTDNVITQRWTHSEGNEKYEMANIFASLFPEKTERIIIGTHYDSKKFANLDNFRKDEPVPGANDSASGVAVLFELARVLVNSKEKSPVGVDLIFFDAEEGIEGSDWQPIGSTNFAKKLSEFYPKEKPKVAVVLDMVCDKNLNIFIEKDSFNSHPSEVEKFWRIASNLYPNTFFNQIKYEIKDDHTPLIGVGIPSFLVIDFDYKHFHKTTDELDKCSAESLEKVGNVVLKYIYSL